MSTESLGLTEASVPTTAGHPDDDVTASEVEGSEIIPLNEAESLDAGIIATIWAHTIRRTQPYG